MRIFLNILNLLIIFMLLFLLAQNLDRVTVRIFHLTLEPLPLYIVILFSTAFGALFGLLFTSISLIKEKNESRAIRKQNKQLRKELDNLRNISIEEIPDEMDEEPGQTSLPKPLNEGSE